MGYLLSRNEGMVKNARWLPGKKIFGGVTCGIVTHYFGIPIRYLRYNIDG